ncbi:hypothetical protein [Thermincola potens]|uniref:DUF1540 domain-containing protein n=1 Tax=Thermincola potens (strain JR) TaxID=635013 RepID=D5X8A9_THEPJ|nr:hypothetical protein [Thermincola potens]ADG82829.1 hypothetical protein TherJR_1982 [Thermincola potens JR]
MTTPCFAKCVHAKDGECRLNIIGSDRLSEFECQCEHFKPRHMFKQSEIL